MVRFTVEDLVVSGKVCYIALFHHRPTKLCIFEAMPSAFHRILQKARRRAFQRRDPDGERVSFGQCYCWVQ